MPTQVWHSAVQLGFFASCTGTGGTAEPRSRRRQTLIPGEEGSTAGRAGTSKPTSILGLVVV
ncbi:hypothetical protein SAMN04487819_109272 [Actinopolyspora alba]|uniref:Uncharacterized protein n=1 Tax=Actinopolyspora alba TaxID=673379 RepID=A0A1I1YVF1_9ACTN|nr:hypothetical protein SAMN04487819_109272 [Actinopolyspora alba]